MKKNLFSLLELLVVIGIITILAGLIFPVFQHIQAKSRQTFCASNLRQLGLALQMLRRMGPDSVCRSAPEPWTRPPDPNP